MPPKKPTNLNAKGDKNLTQKSPAEFFQDNISAQFLAINRKMSSIKRTKHIKAKYYFVKDKIEEGKIT